MAAAAHTLLAIYLNDHFAGSTAAVELARRARAGNKGSELGGLLHRLANEIEEDRNTLAAIMEAVGAKRDPFKARLAWVGEKVGRLKLNGQLTGQSPLSRVIELEGLELGFTGKASLWRALSELQDSRLAAFGFESLADRARRQSAELEPHRVAAGRDAFAGAAG
jgi:hypothetical protein